MIQMISKSPSLRSGRRRAAFLCLTGLLALTVLALLVASARPVDAASVRRVELGQANMKLSPNCGHNFSRDCVAEGRVTAFQALSRGVRGRTFQVPYAGKIVSWSISLANVTGKTITRDGETYAAQRPFFNDIFGSPAKARIAVLRQVKKQAKGAPIYRLVRQSPVQILNPYFGTRVTFALEKPLNVIKGQVIALTIPTWAPALWKPRACNEVGDSLLDPDACAALRKEYSYRARRGHGRCALGRDFETGEPNEALAKTNPQSKIGSERRYACYYGPQALLYSATVVAGR